MNHPRVAAILSGIFPGLGQIYNRHWLKGSGFLIGTGVLGMLLNKQVSFQDAITGNTSVSWKIISLLLVLLILPVWSMVDAYRSAKSPSPRARS